MSAAIEAVVFDIGRVIVEWDLRYLFEKLIEDRDELDWFCANVVTEGWHFQQDCGRALEAMLDERKAMFPAYVDLIDAYANRFQETIPGLIGETARIVEELDARGLRLFAITNFGAAFWDDFRARFSIFDRFEDIVVSGHEGLAKPDPAIFQLAARRFAIEPKRALFIDDNADNIAAARALGWRVHHFRGAPRLRRALAREGLIER